jgi:hypothetical protein
MPQLCCSPLQPYILLGWWGITTSFVGNGGWGRSRVALNERVTARQGTGAGAAKLAVVTRVLGSADVFLRPGTYPHERRRGVGRKRGARVLDDASGYGLALGEKHAREGLVGDPLRGLAAGHERCGVRLEWGATLDLVDPEVVIFLGLGLGLVRY